MSASPRLTGRVLLLLLAVATGVLLVRTGMVLSHLDVPTTAALATSGVLEPGSAAPAFRLATTRGDSLSLADLRGQVVLVDFWATWCPPCRPELRALQTLADRYRGRDLAVLAVAVQSPASQVASLAADEAFTFPVLLGSFTVQAAYRVSSLPTLFVVDRAGVVRHRHVGFAPGLESVLGEEVEELLGE